MAGPLSAGTPVPDTPRLPVAGRSGKAAPALGSLEEAIADLTTAARTCPTRRPGYRVTGQRSR
jgi:hypothetical protein